MRILLAGLDGRVRAEVQQGRISNVTWRLNKTGSADLFISRRDPAFREELLRPGSRIYVEFDVDLPPWGGVLDLPRTWTRGMLQIRAHTIERLLKFARTEKTRAFYSVLVGSIFISVLQEADKKSAIGLDFGQVWYGGTAHYPRYHLRDMMWVINNSLRKMETCDYAFVPFLEDNRIQFRATLQEQLGDDKRQRVALVEGRNVTDAQLTEQGDIANSVAVVGSGATWGERTVVYGNEEESRRRVGLREITLTPTDVSQTATLLRYADTAIRERAYPHTLADMTVTNLSPGVFAAYGVGDVVQVQLPGYGFEGYDAPMRIVARGYDPQTNTCQVVADERFEYVPVLQQHDEEEPG